MTEIAISVRYNIPGVFYSSATYLKFALMVDNSSFNCSATFFIYSIIDKKKLYGN